MSSKASHDIGRIGLGRMGEAMAVRLVKAGHGLSVWNRTAWKADPLAQIGAEIVTDKITKAAPDGYTLPVNSSAHTVDPSIYPGLGYDTAGNLVNVNFLAQQPDTWWARRPRAGRPSATWTRRPRPSPGKLTSTSAGTGGGTHMNAELVKQAGIKVQ